MKIRVRRNNKTIKNEELRYAARYMSKLIMHKNLIKNLNITIDFKLLRDSIGYCEWKDDNHKPRNFNIVIHEKLGRNRMLRTLAHELVHVKQYATGHMKDIVRGPTNIKWNKQDYNEEKVHYYDTPWEIEAYGREVGMYERYKDHLKSDNIKFRE